MNDQFLDAPVAAPDDLTPDERARIAPYVTNTTGSVFALVNLPEAVKGALFARYSRSAKSLRRILLEEFLPPQDLGAPAGEGPGAERAEAFFQRVLADYGDDSVAQLGAAHIAVEGASNILTKILQWGRLASYLEQSTRYIAYDDRPAGQFRYHRPSAVIAHAELGPDYVATLDDVFETYAELIPLLVAHLDAFVRSDGAVPDVARTRAIRARALDGLRGLLPAATRSNVGIFASGQAFEAMLVRMLAHPLPEARDCAALMLSELRQVIPAFLTRVDRPDRGAVHGAYLGEIARAARDLANAIIEPGTGDPGVSVRLLEFDPSGEARVLSHALWAGGTSSLADVTNQVARLSTEQVAGHLATIAGERRDRRHRPGRALEATTYTFEVVCDYGAYRDLQRHRLLSLQAQPLTPALGYDVPDDVAAAGLAERYVTVQERCAALYRALDAQIPEAAAYAVTMAHRIRFTMVMNAREAMHLIELRSQPQGHESYRHVAQAMHREIAEVAGHNAIAAMMRFVDHTGAGGGRMDAEARLERRRRDAALQSPPS